MRRFVLSGNALLGEITGSREMATDCGEFTLKQNFLNLSHVFCGVSRISTVYTQ